MNRKALPSLLTMAYLEVYAEKIDTTEEVINANQPSAEKLQQIGLNCVLAQQLQPLLSVIRHVEIFVTIMQNDKRAVYENGDHIKLLEDLQKKLANYKDSLAQPLSEHVYAAMKKAQKRRPGEMEGEDFNSRLLFGEGGHIWGFLEFTVGQVESFLESSSKATLSDLPRLIEQINALMAIDTTSPASVVKQQLDQVMEKLTILV